MIDLNNLEEIKKLDPKNVFGSTEMFAEQCQQIHEIVERADLPEFNFNMISGDHRDMHLSCIVFSGMGGSAYGGHVATSLFRDELPIPALVSSDYGLPFFVNCDSIVILTSYSGNTEETLSALDSAVGAYAETIGLTSGGELAKLLTPDDKRSLVTFDPINNPSGQPRLGAGYIVLGTIEILRKLGLLRITSDEVVNAINEVKKNREEIKMAAMELSKKIYGKIPMIFSGSIFDGNAHILRNQFNETAKSFSSFHYIPEANHHVLEGLKNPQERKLTALFIDSDIYAPKIKKRMDLTKDVVLKNNADVLSYKALGSHKLSQSLELLAFGGYLTFYLAILYGQDPSVIPWVDYFKEQLAKK